MHKLLNKPSIAEFRLMTRDHFISPIDGAVDLLERIQKARKYIFIVTNNLHFIFNLQSSKLGLPQFVSPRQTITSFDYHVSKSSPGLELFRACLAAVPGLTGEQCVLLDDRQVNLDRAEAAHMKTILCDSEKGGLSVVQQKLERLDVFDPKLHDIRAVLLDIGGVLARDCWEHQYYDREHGIIGRYPYLDPKHLTDVGKKLWEEFAYHPDVDGTMEDTYWQRFISEVFLDPL